LNEIDAACDIYEQQLLDYSNDKIKLCNTYELYADYCIKWGRFDQANILLQKKLRSQDYNFEER